MIKDKLNGKCFNKNQAFMWFGEYVNGTHITEFSEYNGDKTDFYKINKSNLITFGLSGQGFLFYFDTATGVFNLNGSKVYATYETKDRTYDLSGMRSKSTFTDVITYKDAYTDASLHNPRKGYSSGINQYNLGYKTKISFENGVQFSLQNILMIPKNNPAYLEIKIVSNTDLDGELVIKRLGVGEERLKAPLKKNYAGFCHWKVK
jgi:hypothetical protein